MILELNSRDLDLLSPLLSEYFERIDSLGQKKEEKIQKLEIFREFTEKVQQLSEKSENTQIGGYDRMIRTIHMSLEEAWESDEQNGNTKFLTTWKEAWTTKNAK